jgi:hypothetical protein
MVIALPIENPSGKSEEENAPGQWKKSGDQSFANQQEFVSKVHMQIWQRILSRLQEYLDLHGVEKTKPYPIGLLKLLNLISSEPE